MYHPAVLGGEGFFNLSLHGTGTVALESNVPEEELLRSFWKTMN